MSIKVTAMSKTIRNVLTWTSQDLVDILMVPGGSFKISRAVAA